MSSFLRTTATFAFAFTMGTMGTMGTIGSIGTMAALGALAYAGTDHPSELDVDRKPRLELPPIVVVRGATIHTAKSPAFVGDVVIRDGKIAAVGASGKVELPDSGTFAQVIDGNGKHLAPGVVDCHSHIAAEGDVNEGTVSISAEVAIADIIDPDDISIYRALAGGCTTARILHGSANAIGGQDEVIKLKWLRSADELRFPGGPRGIKFALGENPKRSNGFSRGERFPASRLGVEAVFQRAFSRARDYRQAWVDYERGRAAGEDPEPPRRDLRLETLAGILSGDVLVHSHCYRADEILMLLRASQQFGFKIATLQHVLEGYKVAHEMAELGVGGSTFSDWWGYKIEAYDAVPQNAAVMDEAGVLSSVNSDSDELMRHLYMEAAKSMRYADLDAVRTLKLATWNAAAQLGIDARIGSIEAGKDADLVLFDGDPLSAFSKVLWTMVDGRIEFERRDAFELETRRPEVRELSESIPAGALPQGEVVALVGGTIHPVTGPVIENGTLLVQGNRIAALGASANVVIPAGARTFDVRGKHVWPGMIALGTTLGLYEIGSVPATDDEGESQGNQPDVRVAASINADSAHIGVTRTNGITRAQVAPDGAGPLMGRSAFVKLAGDTWEELLHVDEDMLHVRFPVTANDAKKKDEKSEELKALEKTFERARDHARLIEEAGKDGARAPAFDARLSALAPFARGEKTVALHAENAQTILFALRFAKEQKLEAVIYDAREAWKVVDVLAAEQVPVVLGPVLSLPPTRFDPYDAPYACAAVLARAGVPFAIQARDKENTRNLPFQASTAAAFGLPHEEAIRSVTYYPARILGLEKELGSLAVGKLADVVVTDGDLLEIDSPVRVLLIDGKPQSLSNRQTELYERYHERLKRLQQPKGR